MNNEKKQQLTFYELCGRVPPKLPKSRIARKQVIDGKMFVGGVKADTSDETIRVCTLMTVNVSPLTFIF